MPASSLAPEGRGQRTRAVGKAALAPRRAPVGFVPAAAGGARAGWEGREKGVGRAVFCTFSLLAWTWRLQV